MPMFVPNLTLTLKRGVCVQRWYRHALVLNRRIGYFSNGKINQKFVLRTFGTDTGGPINSRRSTRAVIPIWLDSENHGAVRRANSFVERWELHPADFADHDVANLITACGKMNSLEGMQAARDVIDRLRVEQRRMASSENKHVFIGRSIWQAYIFGWACLARNFAEIAQTEIMAAVGDMEEDYRRIRAQQEQIQIDSDTSGDGDESKYPDSRIIDPTVDVYNTALQGYVIASAESKSAPIEAFRLLSRMPDLVNANGWYSSKPNTRTYTLVLSAFAASGHNGYGGRALGVLKRMRNEQDREARNYQTEFGIAYNFEFPDENQRRIVTADSIAHTITLKAMVHSKEEPSLVLKFVQQMEADGRINSFDVFEPYVMGGLLEVYRNMVTETTSSDRCLSLAQEAENTLQKFLSMHKDKFEENGEQILFLYNIVLDIWARTEHVDGPEKCEQLLSQLRAAGGVQPNASSLNCCLNAWRKSAKNRRDADERALMLLSSFERSNDSDSEESCTPDAQSYSLVILTLAENRRNADRFTEARELLKHCVQTIEVVDHGGIDNANGNNLAAPFTAVLAVCATAPSYQKQQRFGRNGDNDDHVPAELIANDGDDDNDPYAIASLTFRELQANSYGLNIEPDHHAFAAYIKCIHRFCAPESTELRSALQSVFQDAQTAGQVSRLVLAAVKRVPGWKEILAVQGDVKSSRRLPKFWWRNVGKKWQ